MIRTRYENIVEEILEREPVAGVTQAILDEFKAKHCSGAFFCRHRKCPRATQGYNTPELRQMHEESHIPKFQCTEVACGFFGWPFNTQAAFKKHTVQYHVQERITSIPDSLANVQCRSHKDRSLQTPQQQALQGQFGGLENSRAQRTPQQNPNIPTLNRPLNPPSPAQNAQRQVQPNPKTGALNIPNGQQAGVNGQPNVGQPSMSQNVQKFQRYVSSMPEPQRTAFLTEFKKRQEEKRAEKVQNAAQSGPLGAPVAHAH